MARSATVDGLLELAAREQVDLDRRRARAAAEPRVWSIGSLRSGRWRSVRPRAAARLESSKAFAKDVHGAAWRAHRPFPHVRIVDEALRCVRSGEFGFPVVAQGRRPGGRQRRRHRGRSRSRRERPSSAAMGERRFGAAGDRRRRSKNASPGPRCRSSCVSDGSARGVDRHRAGSQADLRRGPRAEYRRHGRVRAESAASTRRSRRGSCARSSSR